jgi:hypothetical protein
LASFGEIVVLFQLATGLPQWTSKPTLETERLDHRSRSVRPVIRHDPRPRHHQSSGLLWINPLRPLDNDSHDLAVSTNLVGGPESLSEL